MKQKYTIGTCLHGRVRGFCSNCNPGWNERNPKDIVTEEVRNEIEMTKEESEK